MEDETLAAAAERRLLPTIVKLRARRCGRDIWHDFDTVSEAARFALELDRVGVERLTFPIEIRCNGAIVWGAFAVASELAQGRGTLRQLAAVTALPPRATRAN